MYVNDTYNAATDSFTTSSGYDTQSGTISAPLRTIQKAVAVAAIGDTIYIDAGTYAETVVIDTELLSLIGADSRVTIIDPPGAKTTSGLVAIQIRDCTNVLIKNIGVTDAYDGIQLIAADSCTITSDSFSGLGNIGVYAKSGAEFNKITDNMFFNLNNGGYSIQLDSGQNTISSNTIDSTSYGMLVSAETNTISLNTVKNNVNIGIYLNVAGAYGNLIETNTTTGNGTWGVYLAGPENRTYGNVIKQNTSGGVYISAASNIVRFNLIQSNTAFGMEIANNSAIVEQNDITGNDTGVFFNTASAGILLRKNNIASNNVNNIRNAYSAAQTADRNFWGTTDEVTINAKFNDANSAFRPYRLAKVDTAAGADTTAPAAPTGVTLDTSVAGRIKISWVIPALNEETNGGSVGFNGLKVWRLKNQVDTTNWANSANLVKTLTATDTFWVDTGVTGGETYYYRLSSKDAAAILNESFFTDTKFAAADSALFSSVATTVGMTAASGDGNGGAWGDYDNDTDLDMFVVNYGTADFLFKNDGAGSFTNDATAAGVNGIAGGVGAAWADIDNDGDLDLYVVNNGGANDYMYKNNGAGVFTNVATSVGMSDADNGDGAAWGDYDNDGDLDIYVSNASSAQDFLYRNDGGTFRRVDTTVGMSDGATSYGVAWADYDKDGDLDLFVTHGGTAQDALYKNNGHGQFTNVATSVGMTDAKDGRAAEWGDFDNDGDLDLCVANPGFPYFLYRNDGAGTFTDVATSAGLTDTSHSASGVSWVDYDNDADLDLYFNDANGVQDHLYRNNGNSTFTEEAVHRGITGGGASYGGAWADYDNDGDLDLYVMQSVGDRQDFLYRSRGIPGKNWIKVKPLTDKNGNAQESDGDSDRLAIGALVEIDLNGGANFDTGFGKYVSALLTSNGFTHTAAPVHVGVETAATVDVRVTFPDGDSVTLTGVSTNQTIQIKDTASYTGPNWYVNDTTTAGDSFSAGAGSDVTGKGSASRPFRSITRALNFAKAGDTVYVDAGLYAETVVIDADSISLIGKDSNATVIDPPGANTITTLYGIYADTQTGLTIRNLGVTGAYNGILFENVDISTIASDSASSNGNSGIRLQGGSSSNTISGNEVHYSSGDGMLLVSGCNNNTVDNNIVNSGGGVGIYLNGSSNNTVSRNTVKSNAQYGLDCATSANTNTFFRNIVQSNTQSGIYIQSANTNLFYQNEISGSDTGVRFFGTASGNTATKNNITACNVNFIDNAAGVAQTITRNWYGSTDSATIGAKIKDTLDVFTPYRLGVVDTAAGADTTAPNDPDTVAVLNSPSDTTIILEWSAVTVNEESVGGATGLTGYRVYRSKTKDTSSWIKIVQVGSSTIRYQDTDVLIGESYYYRVTAIDAGDTFVNESFYSDSQPSDKAMFASTVNWYVNDSSTTGDSFTSAAGADTAGGKGAAAAPFKSIPRAMQFATAGDTIWIDAGTYDSYVTVRSTETAGVNMTVDSLTLIGKDSASTVINPPGESNVSGLHGIFADTQTGLLIKNLGVTGASNGILFHNVDISTITFVATDSCATGIDLSTASDQNTISYSVARKNSWGGYRLGEISQNNTLTGNVASGNASIGFITWNSNNFNTFLDNIAENNGDDGFQIGSSTTNNTFTGNLSQNNGRDGFLAGTSCSNHKLTRNVVRNNRRYGIRFDNGSNNNVMIQNTLDSNTSYAVYFESGSYNSDTFQKNVFSGSPTNPDSGVFYPGTATLDFTRNWWGTADSGVIGKRVNNGSGGNKITYTPYRLAFVDTASGADTTAPKAPDTVGIIGSPSDTSIILEWSAVTALEESNGGAVGLSGYRVHRSAVKDTSSWLKVAQVGSGAIRYQDTDVLPGQVFYYRVTAFDAAAFPNESFFSDSQLSDSAVAVSRVSWYVNNNSTTADSFTFATGSDTSGDGTAQKPYRTISKALGIATTGDTIFIDAGLYAETVVIEANSMALVGKDSNATVIDPPGSNGTAGLNGISAANLTGITIKNLGVTGANRGIFFQNVDLATLTGDSIGATGSDGIRLDSGCDTNMIDRTTVQGNSTNYALHVSGNGNTVRQNLFTGNTSTNIIVTAPAQDNLIESNTISGGLYGVWINQGGATRTRILGNVITDMTQIGIPLDTTDSNIIRGNLIRNSAVRGINLYSSQGNVIEQNLVDANPAYTIYIDGTSAGNVIQKNNFIITSPVTPDSGVYNNTSKTHDFSRNWWGTTDEVTIRNRIAGVGADSITFSPYRLRQVDTAIGADTTAPAKPTGVTLDTTSLAGNIVITWVNPTINEETNGGTVGNVGVRVFRLRNLVDTTNWANQVNLVHTGTSTETTWTDTDVNLAVTYYYRLSARDAAALPNDAFFTDTKFAIPSLAANASGRWYVNETYSSASDSFTTIGGSDTAGNGAAANPYRTITKALVQVKAGDTVYIDAGVFSETVVIDTDQISLIGKDSNATVIDPPGASTTTDLYGIYADTQTGLLIRNLGVMDANVGIKFVNVDQSTISGDSVTKFFTGGVMLFNGSDTNTVTNCEATTNSATTPSGGFYLDGSSGNTFSNNRSNANPQQGFYITGSTANTFSGNTANSNTQNGFNLVSGSNKNTFTNNTVQSNSGNGFSISSSSNLTVSNNKVLSNGSNGMALSNSSNGAYDSNVIHNNSLIGVDFSSSSDTNLFTHNSVRHNNTWGVAVGYSFGNVFVQNTLDSNVKDQVYLAGTSASNTFLKNSINPSPQNPDSAVWNNTGNIADMTRNWWFTTDEDVIDRRISDTAGLTFRPYRLGQVDTAAGADTTAPIKPSGVTLDTTTVASAINITWVIPTINEETNGGSVGFAGLNIWRLANQVDTTNWANSVNLVKQTNSTDTTWTDTNILLGSTYYYRLTSKDAATFFNESFFTDTKFASPALAANASGKWYVNVTYNSATDSFTTAAGADTAAGNGTVSAPYRSITKALSQAKAGDTIYIDAGTFSETVVIDTDNVSLIGVDSNLTVIDPPGASGTAGLYGIYATNRTGLLIKNLGVTGAYYGIYFNNVDLSIVSGDSVSACGGNGIYLYSGSDTNTLTGNTASSNTGSGIHLNVSSSSNTVSNNTASSNTGSGIYLNTGSNSNTVSNNTANSSGNGIALVSTNNTLSNNTANSNANAGISMSSNNNTLSSNTADSNSFYGIYLGTNASNDTLINNSTGFNGYGIFLNSTNDNITLRGNTANSNITGIIHNGSNNTLRNNTANLNTSYGIWLSQGSNNMVIQNELKLNTKYQIYISGSSSSDTFHKNNLAPSNTNPDSGVYNSTGNTFDFSRNWWNTADEARIQKMISDTGTIANIKYSPFRLGQVDTAAGADTTAPIAPTGITFDTTSVVGVVRVIWTAPTINEETNGGSVSFAGVKVYRLKNSVDTTHWANALVWTAGASDTNWTDTGVATGNTYYYRLTSRDTAARVNESFFTDTKSSTVTPPGFTLSIPNGGQVWIVGDTQTIAWTTTGSIANAKLEYSTNSGETFSGLITSSTANTGSYAWNIPDAIGNTVRVRLSNAIDSSVFDTSDADFTIRGGFYITRPNGGDSFQAATAENITWTSTGTISMVRLEYSSDSGSTWSVITPSTSNTSSYMWTVPNVSTTQAKVRVSSATDTTTNDTSNDVFQIWPTVVPPPPDKILIVSGNHQLGRILTACTQQIKVQVVDTGGTVGVRYAKVTFLSASNSPQGAATFGNGGLTTTTAYTDAGGYVTETVVLGSTAGVYRIEARLDSTTPSKTALFTAYADGRQVPAGGATAGLGWRMVGPNKAIPSAGWKLNSPAADGGLPSAINVYEYNNTTSSYDAVTANAVRGRAYWVKDATGGRVFVPTEGVASDTPETVSIRLTPPSGGGWFQIASGQYFYTSWDSSVVFDSSPVNDTPLSQSLRMTPSQAGAAGVIQNKAYWYTGSNYIYGPAGETTSLVTMQLKPMVGFWLKVDKACTIFIYPNPVTPETYASEILQQAPAYQGSEGGAAQYLSATYKDMGKTGAEEDWGVQLIAKSGDFVDWQNYIGVKPSAGARQAANAFEAPGVAAGYLTLGVRQAAAKGAAALEQTSNAWMAAQYAAQDKTTGGYAWDVKVATDLAGAATLSWDNTANLPGTYEAYLLGGPGGPVNMRKASSLVLPALSSGVQSSTLTLAVGLSEFVAPFLAAPITKEFSFVYPNPGPDANGNMTFTYNLNGTGEAALKIFDVGGKLVRELRGSGTAGANNTIVWDTTNRHGQKLGSGVYIYILESAGSKLVDKLAIVR